MLKSTSAMSTAPAAIVVERIVGAGRFDQLPFRPDPPEGACHHHAGELAVVHNQNLVLHGFVFSEWARF